jgi:hypothetical protein
MKSLLTSLPLILALGSMAQDQIKITDPSRLVLDPELSKNKAAIASLQAAGMTSEQEDMVLNFSDPKYWPPGLSNDSARKANTPYFQNYTGFLVCNYTSDSTMYSIVMLSAKDNLHMPEDMRPIADLYLVVPAATTQAVLPAATKPAISRGPRWKNLQQVKIITVGDLYATPDLGNDQEANDALLKRGMNQAEIDAVIFRSHERNWPDGISEFTSRQKFLPQFKKYKAYLGAKWGDKVLLIIPVEKNKKMPKLMRPYVDIYFVYKASAVEVKKARR